MPPSAPRCALQPVCPQPAGARLVVAQVLGIVDGEAVHLGLPGGMPVVSSSPPGKMNMRSRILRPPRLLTIKALIPAPFALCRNKNAACTLYSRRLIKAPREETTMKTYMDHRGSRRNFDVGSGSSHR